LQQLEEVSVFAYRFESLGGFVHYAENSEETVSVVNSLIRRHDKGKACCGPVRISNGGGSNPSALRLPEADVSPRILCDVAFQDASDDLQRLKEIDIGVTKADYAVAQTGCLVEVSFSDTNHLLSSASRVHIVVLEATKILRNLQDLAPILRRLFSSSGEPKPRITLISGPSRTSDIEMKMVMGVHGPLEVHVVIVGSKSSTQIGVERVFQKSMSH